MSTFQSRLILPTIFLRNSIQIFIEKRFANWYNALVRTTNVNAQKCSIAVSDEWLCERQGKIVKLTPTGLKPEKKKIDALLKMEAPKTLKEL